MRLDKFLANMGIGTRNEVKVLLKKNLVTVNDKVEKSPKFQIEPEVDKVKVNDELIHYVNHIYIMLNKPKGVISATEDMSQTTVIDLIDEYKHLNLFPVGRLDKDTEGLLLITNDGQFNHELMSPNKHVAKKYLVTSKYPVQPEDIKKFKDGLILSDGPVQSATLEPISDNQSYVTIKEGKYHQIKRMFHCIENEVIQLKRIQIANLKLDDTLKSGEYRLLNQHDFEQLKNK